jgi:hypothetical protein
VLASLFLPVVWVDAPGFRAAAEVKTPNSSVRVCRVPKTRLWTGTMPRAQFVRAVFSGRAAVSGSEAIPSQQISVRVSDCCTLLSQLGSCL